ncbi:MAG: hypothetical protein GTO02_19990 [Candidatus Dadabacteria bacterium]|nr:hypothetical protein [Candidatus Dadabacteria bacterium]NIQ16579.1 hypothetical protein [Candidatus Dadabacteria bacterium]
MSQKKPKIILCGETITLDKSLLQALRKFFTVNIFANYFNFLELPLNEGEKLVLWELSRFDQEELNAISSIKKRHADIRIVVINGGAGTKVAAEILKAGASDIFPKPINYELLVDRIFALLSLKDESKGMS